MGRSRGGLTTKVHALVDAEGRPIALKLTGRPLRSWILVRLRVERGKDGFEYLVQ
jgi:transposase